MQHTTENFILRLNFSTVYGTALIESVNDSKRKVAWMYESLFRFEDFNQTKSEVYPTYVIKLKDTNK